MRAERGRLAYAEGLAAETAACAALQADGWTIRGRRVRTGAGELDVVAERQGLLAVVEVKRRETLAGAAVALSARQRTRLIAAAAALLAEHPDWGQAGIRFDVMLVDRAGSIRRIADAFRQDEPPATS